MKPTSSQKTTNPEENPTKFNIISKKKIESLSQKNQFNHKTLTIYKRYQVFEPEFDQLTSKNPFFFEISVFRSDLLPKHPKPHQIPFFFQRPWYQRIAGEFREISEMEFASCTLFLPPILLSLSLCLPIAKTLWKTPAFSLNPCPYTFDLPCNRQSR